MSTPQQQAEALAAGLYAHQVEGIAFLLDRQRAILADDMGYGDVGVYNSESGIPTPNMDRLASVNGHRKGHTSGH